MKNIISLIAVAFVLYIFTFYVDGEMGIILIAFTLAAALISLAYALYGRVCIKITFDCDAYVKKGSELEVKVNVEKTKGFPMAVIEIIPAASPVFGQPKVYRLTMLKESKTQFSFDLPAEIGGNGEVFIKAVYSYGFLGFIKFRSCQELPPPKSVGVIPEIPEVKVSSGLFRAIADAVITSDNDDENDTAMPFSANTTPGYEHREYVPGDSLKRINWKLSSRSSKFMVRLDEAVSAVQPCIALDLFRSSDDDISIALRREEKLICAVFGLMTLLINQGIACSFVYRGFDGNVISDTADNPDYLQQLLLKVLAVRQVSNVHLNFGALAEKSCTYIVATTDLTAGNLSELIDSIPDKSNACIIIPDDEKSLKLDMPVWHLTDDNNFRQV